MLPGGNGVSEWRDWGHHSPGKARVADCARMASGDRTTWSFWGKKLKYAITRRYQWAPGSLYFTCRSLELG